MTPEEIEQCEINLNIMRLQDALNDVVRHTLEGKVLYNSVKEYIPEFCQFVKDHESYQNFKDLKIGDIINVWEGVSIMSVNALKETINIMENNINALREAEPGKE